MTTDKNLQDQAINTIRFLSADGVQRANSGHPGLPMGAAAIAYTIWKRHLKINPSNPKWMDRDRFVLSGGHGSMLLYSLLYLSGYDLQMEELKNFRHWGSRTPGHPEFGLTPGVETTTGPLGQGFANGIGMAMAEAHLASIFNKPGFEIVNHFTYAIVTDGDLMEGVTSEAASLAGHLKLGKLIYLYDDNSISIEGSTNFTFTEDIAARFESYDWYVQKVDNGNDIEEIDKAIIRAKADPRPSLIICKTIIGYGLPTKQGTAAAHGAPPGIEELTKAKENMNWPTDSDFFVSDKVLAHFREIRKGGMAAESDWKKLFDKYKKQYPELANELARRFSGDLPKGWKDNLPKFEADEKGMGSRSSSGIILNVIAEAVPELMGGSADLAPSNKTWIKSSDAFRPDDPSGRNIHFGVRENAMGSIVNGFTYHGGMLPYGATFLVFSDYMRPAIRISALSHLHSIWVYTHDSIGVGEDGPTHQPVEHILSLRAIPNLLVIRPSDANEVREAWVAALENNNVPTALILSRQNLPTIDRKQFSKAVGLHKGAYILADLGEKEPEVILMASGSEVHLIIDAGQKLAEEGIGVRLVSFPCWKLFEKQPRSYIESVFDPKISARVSVEAGVGIGWDRWVGNNGAKVAIDRFGASAPGGKLFKEFGFTVENVYQTAKNLLSKGS
ncbi:MAG: transketolase [Anaerolineaceae bacterium]|nr:transketolase [Anaerolineaceae bacterium]